MLSRPETGDILARCPLPEQMRAHLLLAELFPPSPQGALSTHNWTYWQCGQYLGVGPGESPENHKKG